MTEDDGAAVLQAVEATYGSLSDPQYFFVREAVSAQPYAGVIDRLSSIMDVQEITDLNDDVSFRYILNGSAEQWTLDLSMVGQFGLLLAARRGAVSRVVTAWSANSDTEAQILDILDRADIALLSREVLEREIPLRRPNDDGDWAHVYQAVISDEPLLPWQAAP